MSQGRGQAARHLSFGLSRVLWLVEAGIFLNMLGYGAVLPFEVIYLHDGRGFSLSVAGLGTPLIGALLLINAATVVVAQVPIARLAEGRRRAVMMAAAASIFAGAFLLVLAAGAGTAIAFAALAAAAIAVGTGECFHTTALMPLTAELAPEGLRGRYLAVIGFSWWIGLAIAPTLGTQLLSRSPTVAFLTAAAVAAGAAVSALALERRLPEASRRTPRPRTLAAMPPPAQRRDRRS